MARHPWFQIAPDGSILMRNSEGRDVPVTMDELFIIAQKLEIEGQKGMDIAEKTADLTETLQTYIKNNPPPVRERRPVLTKSY